MSCQIKVIATNPEKRTEVSCIPQVPNPNIFECGFGKPKTESECQWWINSKKHNFCFWKYVKDRSNIYGEMPELAQLDIAKLLGWSNTKAHFIIKEAMENLETLLRAHQIEPDSNEFSDDLNDYRKFEGPTE